jgi:exopolysaccharide biosynthesis polyprenyl glycosylphosphotransferase
LVRLRPVIVGDLISLEVHSAPLNWLQRAIKRAIDLTIAVPLGLFLLPLFAGIAIAVKLDSRGPVFFRQQRLGYRGEAFYIYKFRTMTVLEDGPTVVQATKDDQRVTRVGRWLRKSSLDELPQIFNVLSGKMSLVGPRPHPIALDKLYSQTIEHYELRQHVKPGITGWAQVNGLRGETQIPALMERRINYDIWYAKNASISLDIEVLLRTPGELFLQRNAY